MMRGMGNMQNMMKQMKKMQQQMATEQAALNEETFTGKAPDDMVTVTFTGDKKMQDISIKPAAVDPDDVDMLQDLIVAAVNDALTQVDSQTQDTMGKYTKGLK
ncbi:YbaB/EbfC family nucleoid-associated protein [Lactiplantibacillus sp. WILCCON 0030]|uniref:Nucleoid-associated protein RA086_02615 n=1 Tax=Lactiplantibacillus brownii TaxID=3069269 RepID=A0ABU1A6N6_9LACO|nr:YbaB/EbfC family nucleoid-associated protein [Lactiplantibacillus brownii]MDQ7936538.1 YbaB/EbfC family nucleoid-associated protein [Lactiplantibacillus brownii]